jgi:hypothetical protein
MSKVHYTYIVKDIDTDEFYIGSRSCEGKAADDIKYMGSMVAWKPNKSNLVKTILNDTFLTREMAIEEEIHRIKENINNPLNKNYNIPGVGFHNTGRVFNKSSFFNFRTKFAATFFKPVLYNPLSKRSRMVFFTWLILLSMKVEYAKKGVY